MTTTGGDPSFLRRLNSAAVLRVLHAHEPADSGPSEAGLTVSQIAAAVNVSRPTAEEAADALQNAGWIEVLSPQLTDRRGAGRPARRFRFRPDAGYVVGIAVEAASVAVAVADLAGTVVATDRRAAPPTLEAGERLETLRSAVAAALAAGGITPQAVLGGTAGTTGIVDAEGRVVLNNLPGWTGLHLAGEVEAILDAPSSSFNHLRLSALGERWRGAAQNADDVVHVHAGQRMGLGVVIGGRPLIGAHGAAGEFSAAIANAWLDAYRSLLAHPLAQVLTERSAGVGGDIGDANAVFDAAAEGDESARDAVQEFARAVAVHTEPIISAFDPAIVVLGGDLARAGIVSVEPVQRHLDVTCVQPPEVRVSQLGDDSITLGAIRSALDEVETRLFTDLEHLSPS